MSYKYSHYFSDNRKGTDDSVVSIIIPITHEGDTLDIILSISQLQQQLYHPAAQDRSPTEAKQGWAGQYLDGRPPVKTRLLLEEVQGFFICHMINYTGYNQKWNVVQIRSAQCTVQRIKKKKIYI